MNCRILKLTLLMTSVWLGMQRPTLGQGIPEPGLVIYGVVSNLPPSAVNNATFVWTNRRSAEIVITPATWVVVNDTVFHQARIPFETRFTGTLQQFAGAPNTFDLPSSQVTFTRSAGIDKQPLQFAVPAQSNYTFGPADRGRVDRVDLITSGGSETFEQWITRFRSIPADLRGPNDDPDRDGVKNGNEFTAGTDPNDSTSVLKFTTELKPTLAAGHFDGIVIEWLGVPGKRYSIERTEDLGKDFTPLKSGVSSTDLKTTYPDSTANGPGPYFYRIRVEP